MRMIEQAAKEIVQHGYTRLELDREIQEAISATYRAGYEFFRSPPEEKLQSMLSNDCGYRPRGIEYSQTEDHPDEMESFAVTAREEDSAGCHGSRGHVLFEQMRVTIALLEPLAEQLAVELARIINADFDLSKIQGALREWSCLQLNYSQPADCSAELINDPHEDGHLLTLATADAPGLEIQTTDGNFVPLQRREGSVLVMPGDTTRLLSGGIIQPLYHQVRRHAGIRERLALVYFGDFDPSRCEPWVSNEVNQNVDIGARIRANSSRFGLEGFTSD